jgi:NADPH:quinone reductase-like Zn-dependent oxidoreductase
MRAITTTGHDDLHVIETAVPEPGPGEIRIAVTAAGVNSFDIAVRRGVFHRLGMISRSDQTGLGWDVAGTVDALGSGVDGPPVGTPVAAMLDDFDVALGGYAEFAISPAAGVAALPRGVDPIAAATVPTNALTADQALDLIDPANLVDAEAGRRLLVTGAGGAVGGYAVTLAARRGWQVTALARSTDEEFLRSAGASEVLTELPVAATDGDGFDAVFDAAVLVGPALAAVRDGGSYLGVQPSDVPRGPRGITTVAVTSHHDGARLAALLALVATGELPTRIAGTLPLVDAAQAQANISKGGQRGRWVLLA